MIKLGARSQRGSPAGTLLSLFAFMHLRNDSPSLFSVTATARHLRKRATRSEVLLWQQLRQRKLGVRFRRQHPFGRYVVDFYAACAKLIVEIDGVHDKQREYDAHRGRI